MESADSLVSQIIVADAGLPGTKSGATKPASLRVRTVDRDFYASGSLRGRPRRRHDVDKIAVDFGQIDAGRSEFAAIGRCLAHPFEQLGPGLGPHDRFVGRAEGGKHSRQTLLLLRGPGPFLCAIEIFEGE